MLPQTSYLLIKKSPKNRKWQEYVAYVFQSLHVRHESLSVLLFWVIKHWIKFLWFFPFLSFFKRMLLNFKNTFKSKVVWNYNPLKIYWCIKILSSLIYATIIHYPNASGRFYNYVVFRACHLVQSTYTTKKEYSWKISFMIIRQIVKWIMILFQRELYACSQLLDHRQRTY